MSRKRKISEVDGDDDRENVVEEQVLSHAAQRRLRKRQKVTSDDLTPRAEGHSTSKSTEDASSTVNSIWIGNLAFRTTPQALKAFFGELAGDITRIHLPTKSLHGVHAKSEKARGDNKGFAYVDFASLSAKEAAIAKSENELDGRRLLIKDGSDFAGRPGGQNATNHPLTGLTKTARKILAQQKNEPCPTLFLGNLSFETTEDEIAALFGRVHPKLKVFHPKKDSEGEELPSVRVRMGTFEDSGKCKGFAFVDFTDAQSATDALTNPRNHSLNGRALIVEYASPDAVRRGQVRIARDSSSKKPSRRPQKSERIAAKLANRSIDRDPGNRENVSVEGIEEKGTKDKHSQRPKDATTSKPRRLKPGASLANAERGTVAIVESTGKHLKFE